MLKCKEVSKLVATDGVADLGLLKKFEFRMHLLMCVHCRRYVQQIRALGRGTRHWAAGCEADQQQLERMEGKVQEELKNRP